MACDPGENPPAESETGESSGGDTDDGEAEPDYLDTQFDDCLAPPVTGCELLPFVDAPTSCAGGLCSIVDDVEIRCDPTGYPWNTGGFKVAVGPQSSALVATPWTKEGGVLAFESKDGEVAQLPELPCIFETSYQSPSVDAEFSPSGELAIAFRAKVHNHVGHITHRGTILARRNQDGWSAEGVQLARLDIPTRSFNGMVFDPLGELHLWLQQLDLESRTSKFEKDETGSWERLPYPDDLLGDVHGGVLDASGTLQIITRRVLDGTRQWFGLVDGVEVPLGPTVSYADAATMVISKGSEVASPPLFVLESTHEALELHWTGGSVSLQARESVAPRGL